MGYRIIVTLSLFLIIGCSTSLVDLNKIAKDALKTNQELKEQASSLFC